MNEPCNLELVAAVARILGRSENGIPLSVAKGDGWCAFRLLGKPVSQNAAYQRGRGRRLFKTEPAKKFQENIAIAAQLALPDAWSVAGVYDVEIIYHFGSRRNDGNNPVKLTLDAMEGIMYQNDRQVRDVLCRKRYDAEQPRTTVVVRHVGENYTW